MRISRIKSKVERNEAALCTTLTLAAPELFELVSILGFDGIWLDMEHHQHSVETATQLIRAARVGDADVVARPAKGEFMRMGRMLEAGAQAIMYPRCESVEEAQEVVRWAKFAPLGQRGFDGANPDADYLGHSMTDYMQHANRQTVLIIQIEEQKALDRAEAIAAVPGVDFLMLGPADYSILSGIAGQFDNPRMTAAHQAIATAARNTGKNWARTCSTTEVAKETLAMGAKLIFQGADIVFLRRALEQLQKEYREIGFEFGNGR
jgi:4-hydroxy-2-oxoheptanedioate aldolase